MSNASAHRLCVLSPQAAAQAPLFIYAALWVLTWCGQTRRKTYTRISHVHQCVLELLKVDATETGDGVPALGRLEAQRAAHGRIAAIDATRILADGHIAKHLRGSFCQLVQSGIDKSETWLARRQASACT